MSARSENTIWVDAGMEQVWNVTNDVARWPDLFSEYASVEVLARTANTVRFRLTMHPDENGTEWSWVSERTADPATRTVRSRRVETGPFEYMRIFWEYRTENGGVRMIWKQEFRMRPDAPVTDEQMLERINTNTPIQMKLIKDKLEAR
ncbi:polyketide cyclase [Amycolatopsis balhimycina DSM 5908]|uniref:Polyketide cyclase n=1 Tax=Amycolatopsis balhimycina DSM 5908 TaxID=1081091 RepID=A0A428WPA7_AMYBA|nr:SRPBCC family protein [Amycolatopsis balhimycina]RSM44880.1 polyketide cyclase [Amycolatopsis balhimycina DSM 5908]